MALPKIGGRSISVGIGLSPALLVLIVLTASPMLLNLVLAFAFWRGGIEDPRWIGLSNFDFLLGDTNFMNAVVRSATFTFGSVTAQMLLGLLIAIMLTRRLRGSSFFRVALLLPMVMTPVVSALTFKTLIYDPNWGLAGFLFDTFGLGRVAILSDVNMAILGVVLVDIWHWTPFVTIIIFAGLLSVPVEPLEASHIDGANAWQRFRFVVLPMIMPVLLVAGMLRMLDAFRTFDMIYVMTQGGPGRVTMTLPIYIYETMFSYSNFGGAAATGLAMTVFSIVIIAAFTRALSASRGAGY